MNAHKMVSLLATVWLAVLLSFLPVLAGGAQASAFVGDGLRRSSVSLSPAADITVNTLVDESDGECAVDCSLRDAVALAVSGDTIYFSVANTITLSLGQIEIAKNLTISGPGANSLAISGGGASTVFRVGEGYRVTISGVTIAKGYAGGSSGGGIYNQGSLTVTDSVISGGRAYFGGGIYNEGAAMVTNTTFSGNKASTGYGGAIHNYGYTNALLTVTECIFSGNSASYGGAIHGGGTLYVIGSAFSGNTVTTAGSAIHVVGTAQVTASTFSGNFASDRGTINNAGSLQVTGSTFSGNETEWGNIHNDGEATVTNSTFDDNYAIGGGGILNESGTLTVTNSTFSGNSGPDDESYGGGLDNTGAATVINCTFTGNYAVAGGGIGNWGMLTLINSTLSNNSADDGGGLYTSTSEGTAVITNTIIANSTAGENCHGAGIAGSANNLSTDATCSGGFILVTPVQLALGTLAGNPAYYRLNAGSVAIDAGTSSACPATDQRGMARPQDGDGDSTAVCDVGSYEYLPFEATDFVYLPLVMW